MLFVYFSIYPNLSRVELAVNFDFNLIVNKDFKEFEKSCFSRNWSKVYLFIEKRDFCDLWQLLFLCRQENLASFSIKGKIKINPPCGLSIDH